MVLMEVVDKCFRQILLTGGLSSSIKKRKYIWYCKVILLEDKIPFRKKPEVIHNKNLNCYQV
jgi:hypothetical protein